MDERKQDMKNQIAKNYILLKSLLTDPFEGQDRLKTSQLLKDFFTIQGITSIPYTGLILLDRKKKGAYTLNFLNGTQRRSGKQS